MSAQHQVRNSILELSGLVLAMLGGAIAGMVLPIPVKGEGLIATIVVFALIGAIVWVRRHQPLQKTLIVCLYVVALSWPLAVVILDWLHKYY